ncbi:MAG: hypothetical protein ACYTBJ_18430 [Planctomycetota bacterium]|jgi:hypothetical protein
MGALNVVVEYNRLKKMVFPGRIWPASGIDEVPSCEAFLSAEQVMAAGFCEWGRLRFNFRGFCSCR